MARQSPDREEEELEPFADAGPVPCQAMEEEERRIWVKWRCWSRLKAEDARFLLLLDGLRGYTQMPGETHVNTHCWETDARLSWSQTEHWLTALKNGHTVHGPYAPTGVWEERC